MRAPMRVMTAVTAAILTLTVIVPAGSLAQDASGDPTGDRGPFCAVLTADEAGAALGAALRVGTGSTTDCSYVADASVSDLGLTVYRDDGPLTDEYPRSYYPDGVDLKISDHAAYYDATNSVLFVDEGGNDQLFVLQVFGSTPDGLDVQAALESLAVTGLPRLADIALPAAPSVEPEPSFFGDAELAALIPSTIGGSPVDVQTLSGADVMAQTDAEDADAQDQLQALEDALTTMGKSMDDLSLAFGSFPTEDSFGNITAIRLKGAEIATVTDVLVPLLLTADVLDPQQTPAVVAGKNVTILSDGPLDTGTPDPAASIDPYDVGGDRAYIYPKGEVLWFVTVTEPYLTEVFQKLP